MLAPQKTGALPGERSPAASVMAGAPRCLDVRAGRGLRHAPRVQMHRHRRHLHVPAGAAYAKLGGRRGGHAAVRGGGFSSAARGPFAGGAVPVGP